MAYCTACAAGSLWRLEGTSSGTGTDTHRSYFIRVGIDFVIDRHLPIGILLHQVVRWLAAVHDAEDVLLRRIVLANDELSVFEWHHFGCGSNRACGRLQRKSRAAPQQKHKTAAVMGTRSLARWALDDV